MQSLTPVVSRDLQKFLEGKKRGLAVGVGDRQGPKNNTVVVYQNCVPLRPPMWGEIGEKRSKSDVNLRVWENLLVPTPSARQPLTS